MNDTQLNYLKSVLLSQLLLEANDQLKMTKQYKLNIKNQINKLDVMLEEVVREQVSQFFENNQLFPKHQHGFRPMRSTTTAHIALQDHLKKAKAAGKGLLL